MKPLMLNNKFNIRRFYDNTRFNLLYKSANIIEITIPFIILKGITPDKMIIFRLLKTSPKLKIIPYNGSKTK